MYDSKCYELAELFLREIAGCTERDVERLAQALQDACEDACEEIELREDKES